MRTGQRLLDMMMVEGIVTIRCRGDPSLLLANVMVRNLVPGKRVLYLHWVDYHKRSWTLDHDMLLRLAKEQGVGESILESVYFMRAFSKDSNDSAENWERIMGFGDVSLAILDSVSELYEDGSGGTMTYAIGKFVQLCVRSRCMGLIVDRSPRPVHNYLAHVSTAIIEIGHEVRLLKHPCMAEMRVPRDGQYRLVEWIC